MLTDFFFKASSVATAFGSVLSIVSQLSQEFSGLYEATDCRNVFKRQLFSFALHMSVVARPSLAAKLTVYALGEMNTLTFLILAILFGLKSQQVDTSRIKINLFALFFAVLQNSQEQHSKERRLR